MKARAIALLICIGLSGATASTGFAQSKQAPSASSKPALSEIRSLVYKLQGQTEKLQELMTLYRELLDERPKGSDEKWSAAMERLLVRIEASRTTVVEAKQRLDELVKGSTLPTALGKDVATAQNEADAERADADQALAKRKATARATAKPTKKAPASEPASAAEAELDDL